MLEGGLEELLAGLVARGGVAAFAGELLGLGDERGAFVGEGLGAPDNSSIP